MTRQHLQHKFQLRKNLRRTKTQLNFENSHLGKLYNPSGMAAAGSSPLMSKEENEQVKSEHRGDVYITR